MTIGDLFVILKANLISISLYLSFAKTFN